MNQVAREAATYAETEWENRAAVPRNNGERRASGDHSGRARWIAISVNMRIAAKGRQPRKPERNHCC